MAGFGIRISDFGLPSAFGFRVSDLPAGFPAAARFFTGA